MSRQETASTLRTRIRDLEAQVARWRQDYKDLATAMARRDGYSAPSLTEPAPPERPALPTSIVRAVEDTTDPFSDARRAAFEIARDFLAQGVTVEALEARLRAGDDVQV